MWYYHSGEKHWKKSDDVDRKESKKWEHIEWNRKVKVKRWRWEEIVNCKDIANYGCLCLF
jgi:hypothetical protein